MIHKFDMEDWYDRQVLRWRALCRDPNWGEIASRCCNKRTLVPTLMFEKGFGFCKVSVLVTPRSIQHKTAVEMMNLGPFSNIIILFASMWHEFGDHSKSKGTYWDFSIYGITINYDHQSSSNIHGNNMCHFFRSSLSPTPRVGCFLWQIDMKPVEARMISASQFLNNISKLRKKSQTHQFPHLPRSKKSSRDTFWWWNSWGLAIRYLGHGLYPFWTLCPEGGGFVRVLGKKPSYPGATKNPRFKKPWFSKVLRIKGVSFCG